MDYFEYRDGELFAEDVPVSQIAERFGSPSYVYSRATLERHFRAFDDALSGTDHFVCYAVKANSNLAVLQVLARLGAGFDIVSAGELFRVLRAGGEASRVVFSGVGKTRDEMRTALRAGIYCFNVESEYELLQLDEVARELQVRAPVSLRVNPDVDARTHPYISTGLKENKFGVDIATAERLYAQAATMPGIEMIGVASHIGSQLLEIKPFLDALERVLALVDRIEACGVKLRHIDVGGGLGVRYLDENPPHPREWALAIKPRLAARGLRILTEPGRAIAGNAGILVTRVLGLKHTDAKAFAVVDAAMNDLLRPTLYQAWMNIVPVRPRSDAPEQRYDIVGPVCETGDWLGKDRELALAPGDLLAVRTAGAYGFVMASNYNSRPRVAEVLVDGSSAHLVRERESHEDLVRGEHLLP
ncbi:MAG: diaminopimelate decarboxylase [Nevskiales bacterium]|nr:diaminopimelate decarboxylase [Nevskiales bacterium]